VRTDATATVGDVVNKKRMTYTEFLDNQKMTKFLWFLVFGVIIAEILDGMDFQITAFALPGIIKEFKLNPAQAGVVSSIGNIGLMVGATVFSLLADRFGRKPMFTWVIFTFAVGSLLSAIAPSYNALLWARFICGLGLGAEMPIGTTVLAEFAPRKHRHTFVIMVPLVWAIGFIVASVLSIAVVPTHGWRAIYWVGTAPVVFIVAVRFFLPESVRWLISKGRVEEAAAITKNIARRAGMADIELVPPVLSKDEVKLSFGRQISMLSAVRVPALVIAFAYFGYFLQNWGIAAWLPTMFMRQGFDLMKSFTYTLISMLAIPISQLLSGVVLQEKMNRKWALFIAGMGGTVFCVLFGISLQRHWSVQAIVTLKLLQTLVQQGTIAICMTLCAELFPTPVRSLGSGFVQALGRFGAVLGPFILGLLLKIGVPISNVLYALSVPVVLASIVAVVGLKFDPRQRALEDISVSGKKATIAAGH